MRTQLVIAHEEYARKLQKYLLHCVKNKIAPNTTIVNDAKEKLRQTK